MRVFTMREVISLLRLPRPPDNRADYNIQCPCCDKGRDKHLNIHLGKNVFRCPRCGFSGGVLDFYAHYTGVSRDKVRQELLRITGEGGQDTEATGGSRQKRSKPEPEPPPMLDYAPTDIESRDKTYRALFDQLSLASDHRDNLLGRGLDDHAIEKFGYRTTPMVGHDKMAKFLLTSGCYLTGVPGFHRDENGEWTLAKTKRGIMIPVRDCEGRIQGLQIRRDNIKRRKFRWLSSKNLPDGCGPEGWTHFAGPIEEEILLIEGPMKGDVVHHLTGRPVLAVPGVNALTQLEPVLEQLRELGVRKIMTCFDMDYLNKWQVQNGYTALINCLNGLGFKFGTYLWLPTYNGLDDYIWKYEMQSGCRIAA